SASETPRPLWAFASTSVKLSSIGMRGIVVQISPSALLREPFGGLPRGERLLRAATRVEDRGDRAVRLPAAPRVPAGDPARKVQRLLGVAQRPGRLGAEPHQPIAG